MESCKRNVTGLKFTCRVKKLCTELRDNNQSMQRTPLLVPVWRSACLTGYQLKLVFARLSAPTAPHPDRDPIPGSLVCGNGASLNFSFHFGCDPAHYQAPSHRYP